MPCSTVSSLAISTSSSAYFTVWIICPPILKSPSPSRDYLVRHSLYNLNRTGDKQHPCLTLLPVCTLLDSPRSRRTLTLWSMYNLLINLLSRQSIPVLFMICINLVQFTRSNAFCQSMKQTQSSSAISKVRSAIIIIPNAFLVPFPLLNPNWSSPSTASIFFSILLLSIFAIIYDWCIMFSKKASQVPSYTKLHQSPANNLHILLTLGLYTYVKDI